MYVNVSARAFMCNLIQKLVANLHRIGFVDYPMIILQFLQLGAVVVVACFPVILRLSYTLRVAEDTR